MKAWKIFAALSPELAARVFDGLAQNSRGAYAQLLANASAALSMRPKALRAQPPEQRARLLQRALAKVSSEEAAGDVLAEYFLAARADWLCVWLDALGLAHDAGVLHDPSPPEPPRAALESALQQFHAHGASANADELEHAERALLLRTFAAQDSLHWPTLEALLDAADDAAR